MDRQTTTGILSKPETTKSGIKFYGMFEFVLAILADKEKWIKRERSMIKPVTVLALIVGIVLAIIGAITDLAVLAIVGDILVGVGVLAYLFLKKTAVSAVLEESSPVPETTSQEAETTTTGSDQDPQGV